MLVVNSLEKRFGGLKAVDNVSFTVRAGQVCSVIGPNGAGKTTLINLISGLYTPDAGKVTLDGRTITGMQSHRLSSLGISRTFQNLQVCMDMTALDNVLIGAHSRLPGGVLKAIFRIPEVTHADRSMRVEAEQLLEKCGIFPFATALASQMPYGALKRLEIARALISKPKLLLLDEPAAGLNHTETAEIILLVSQVASAGVTVLLVEHDMKLVMQLSTQIVVLNNGRHLAEGTPSEIANHPDVIAAYLGAEFQSHEPICIAP